MVKILAFLAFPSFSEHFTKLLSNFESFTLVFDNAKKFGLIVIDRSFFLVAKLQNSENFDSNMVFTYTLGKFVIEMLMNGFKFADDHNDLNKKIGAEFL